MDNQRKICKNFTKQIFFNAHSMRLLKSANEWKLFWWMLNRKDIFLLFFFNAWSIWEQKISKNMSISVIAFRDSWLVGDLSEVERALQSSTTASAHSVKELKAGESGEWYSSGKMKGRDSPLSLALIIEP